MEVFTASGEALVDILTASGGLIQASFGSLLNSANLIWSTLSTSANLIGSTLSTSANLIASSLSTSVNDIMIPSLGYVPFLQTSSYYVDDVLITPFLDVNAPTNPLTLNGFLLP